MALGYLSKALSRAGPTQATASVHLTSAARTGSPLAEVDQRLHDTPQLNTSTEYVSPPIVSTESPSVATNELHTENMQQEYSDSVNEPNAAAHSPLSSALGATSTSDGLKRSAGEAVSEATPETTPEEQQTPPVGSSVHKAVRPNGRGIVESKAEYASTDCEPLGTSSPTDSLSRALANVEKWVANQPHEPPHSQTKEDSVPPDLHAENEHLSPVTRVPPSAQREHSPDVEPIIRHQTDMLARRPEPPAPTVEIGSIEIEILPPPVQTPKPVQRSAPARPPPPAVAPFGWRQR